METIKNIFSWRWLMLLFAAIAISASLTACGDDDDDNEPGTENGQRDHDGCLEGEWISYSGTSDLYKYLYFDSDDGTGIEGWYESYIDSVDEDTDFTWYTVDDKYLFIDGVKYTYWCDGTELELTSPKGREETYYAKD